MDQSKRQIDTRKTFNVNSSDKNIGSNENEKISSSNEEICNLDNDQLQALLHDDQYLDDFVEELQPVKSLNTELDFLIENNEKLAYQNLDKESALDDLKSSIESLSIEFVKLGERYHETNRKYAEKSLDYKPENIRQLMEIAVSNAESKCEEYVDEFLSGNQSLNQFLDNFMETKKLIATRKFKEEQLNFQLNQLKL